MGTRKQQQPDDRGLFRPDGDTDRDPGIGQSKGSFMTGEDPEEIEGDNTVEGDVENDVDAVGGVPEREPGRTNK